MKNLTESDVCIEVICHPEDIPIEGNYIDSGDDEYDKKCEQELIEKLEQNQWAWCLVEVKVRWKGIEQSSYLGCCSCEDEKDFMEMSGGYFQNLLYESLNELNLTVQEIVEDVT